MQGYNIDPEDNFVARFYSGENTLKFGTLIYLPYVAEIRTAWHKKTELLCKMASKCHATCHCGMEAGLNVSLYALC